MTIVPDGIVRARSDERSGNFSENALPGSVDAPTVDLTPAHEAAGRAVLRRVVIGKGARGMDIVTIAGTGRHVASRRYAAVMTPLNGVVDACEQQGPQFPRPRVRRRDLRTLPTDPQRPSAPSWWVT